jgi:hypothetical protein
MSKLAWSGTVTSVQPRIWLTRSFDERSHSYLGYLLRLVGQVGNESREFTLGIGKAAQAKHQLQAGDEAAGFCEPSLENEREPADFYKVSRLAVTKPRARVLPLPPPWQGVPPTLEVYRERGHRRLDARTYEARCLGCIWGCRMPVVMIVDQWNPSVVRRRVETFCYGPKSCAFHRPGPTRKVPGRRGMSWEEEDWVDEEATSHRGPDD